MKNVFSVIPEYFCRESRISFLLFLFLAAGCQTTAHNSADHAETVSAMTTVTQGLTNQPLSQAQLKALATQVAHDPQAQSALRSINTSFSTQQKIKYCPVDGQRFSPDMEECPIHHVKLKMVE